MQVVGDEQVLLRVQERLLVARGVVGAPVLEFHQTLIGHADPLAAVVAGVARLHRDAATRLARAVQPVLQEVTRLLLVDRRVVTLVVTLIAVEDVAG